MLNPSVREELVMRTHLLVAQAKPIVHTPDESNIENLAWIVNVLVQEILAREDRLLSKEEVSHSATPAQA